MEGMARHKPPRTRVIGYRAAIVLEYVERTIEADGRAPSYSMIRDECDLSSKAKVCRIVDQLERRGLLRRAGEGRVRRIRLPRERGNCGGA